MKKKDQLASSSKTQFRTIHLTRAQSVVDANDKSACDDHFPGVGHLAEAEEDCRDEGKDLVDEQTSFATKSEAQQCNKCNFTIKKLLPQQLRSIIIHTMPACSDLPSHKPGKVDGIFQQMTFDRLAG